MRTAIRRMGNSNGIILPKAVLAQLGVTAGDSLDISLEEGARLVLVPSGPAPRAGWDEAAQAIAAAGDDALVWPEFSNADDADLAW